MLEGGFLPEDCQKLKSEPSICIPSSPGKNNRRKALKLVRLYYFEMVMVVFCLTNATHVMDKKMFLCARDLNCGAKQRHGCVGETAPSIPT